MLKGAVAVLACAAVTLGGACGARAATVAVEQTIETYATTGSLAGVYSPNFGPTVTSGSFTGPAQVLNIGDTLDWRLKAAPGGVISLAGLHGMGISTSELLPGDLQVTATGSISFLDDVGHVVLAGSAGTNTNNTAVVTYFAPTSAGVSASFSEIDAIIHLDGFSNYSLGAPPPGADFSPPDIYFLSADRITVPGPFAPTPEPSTWALMLIGLAMVGVALRPRAWPFKMPEQAAP
jgi:hypothetical protein